MKKYQVYTEDFNGIEELKLSTYNKVFAEELRDAIEYDGLYAVVWIETIFEG